MKRNLAPIRQRIISAKIRVGTDVQVGCTDEEHQLNFHFFNGKTAVSVFIFCCNHQWWTSLKDINVCRRCGKTYEVPDFVAYDTQEETLQALLSAVAEKWTDPLSSTILGAHLVEAFSELEKLAAKQKINGGNATPKWTATVENWSAELSRKTAPLLSH